MASQKDPDSEFINNLSLGELSIYIVKRHHAYVREQIPVIKKNLDKICHIHGGYQDKGIAILNGKNGLDVNLRIGRKLVSHYLKLKPY